MKLWDVSRDACLRTFEGHTSGVTSVCLSADGRYALSGSMDKSLKLWALDWELEDKQCSDWDEAATPYLQVFLAQRTPFVVPSSADPQATEEELTPALTRQGKPTWEEADFQRLLDTLRCVGFGWLHPEGVRRKLNDMATNWRGPEPLPEPALSTGSCLLASQRRRLCAESSRRRRWLPLDPSGRKQRCFSRLLSPSLPPDLQASTYREQRMEGPANAWEQYDLGKETRRGRESRPTRRWQYTGIGRLQNRLFAAQSALGELYEQGKGVERSLIEAVRLYRLAADQDHSIAQWLLARCYRDGRGVEQNFGLAEEWLLKASERGSSSAQYDSGEMHEHGHAVSGSCRGCPLVSAVR